MMNRAGIHGAPGRVRRRASRRCPEPEPQGSRTRPQPEPPRRKPGTYCVIMVYRDFTYFTLRSKTIVCPGSSDPSYVVSYYIKWVTTSWTYGTNVKEMLLMDYLEV